nr:immunoglobulin heavy chain junction region [Macaca mulatta]MOV86869.1 immunoglobulin heavy chain junction region [Macaca mulatta]MOV86924.1 immunoglobulin heavy chain junction region [Macaca mulatta]MOV87366.1 immunoglobulin heavy chain junction region [Macaca mulatta]MOV87380.1 immunoglobulin heavy chain junction region [Macaca mulatta]
CVRDHRGSGLDHW